MQLRCKTALTFLQMRRQSSQNKAAVTELGPGQVLREAQRPSESFWPRQMWLWEYFMFRNDLECLHYLGRFHGNEQTSLQRC